MTDADLARRVDLDLLISSLRGEARIADRPGQYDRLNAAADVVVDVLEYIQRLTAERDALAAQLDALRGRIEGLHRPDEHGPGRCDKPDCITSCRECGDDWPCATIRTLAADEGEASDRDDERERRAEE